MSKPELDLDQERHVQMTQTAITCDQYGPLCTLSRKGRCAVLDTDSMRITARFELPESAFGDQAGVSSEWAQWFGAGAKSVYAVSLRNEAKPAWSRHFPSLIGGVVVDQRAHAVIVIFENDQALALDRHTGNTRKEIPDIEWVWCIGNQGELCFRHSDLTMSVYEDGRSIKLNDKRFRSRDRVIGVCKADQVIAVSWFQGGITLYDAATGNKVSEISETAWIFRMTWNAESRRLFGFGAIGSKGEQQPLWVDPSNGTFDALHPALPDQREFVRGCFCSNARACVLENGYVWRIRDNAVVDIPDPFA